MTVEFAQDVVTVGGRAETILTRDGRVWAMVETDCPTADQLAEAERLAASRYTGR